MPQNALVPIPAKIPTLLTSNDVTGLTFQNMGGQAAQIQGAAGLVVPAVWGPIYAPGFGQPLTLLSELFPGSTGFNRVYAYSEQATSFWVCHA